MPLPFTIPDATWLLESASLALLLAVGLFCSLTDIRARIVPNACTWGLVGVGAMLQLAYWREGLTSPGQAALVLVGGLAVAMALNALGLWSPGDAKLYWGMAVALPPWLLRDSSLLSLDGPLAALVTNALLIHAVFLGGLLVVLRRRRRAVPPGSPRAADPARALWLGAELAAILGLLIAAHDIVRTEPLTFLEALPITVVLALLADRFASGSRRLVWLLPGVGAAGFVVLTHPGLGDLLALWATAWALTSAYWLVRHRFGRGFLTQVPFADLQPGMMPAVAVQPAAAREKRVPGYVAQAVAAARAVCRPNVPLTRAQVTELQRLARQGRLKAAGDGLLAEEDVPFAPFLLAGLVATVLLAGTPLQLLTPLTAGVVL